MTGLCVARDFRIFLFGEHVIAPPAAATQRDLPLLQQQQMLLGAQLSSGPILFRQHRLHDQHPAAAFLSQSLSHSQSQHNHYNNRTNQHEQQWQQQQLNSANKRFANMSMGMSQSQVHGILSQAAIRGAFGAVDNLVQGVCIRELSSCSPLATVWSLRRLALLRVQLLSQRGVEVLRCEEYAINSYSSCR